MHRSFKDKLHPIIAVVALAIPSLAGAADTEPPLPPSAGAIPVTVVKEQGRYTLMRGGQPYWIKGAGTNSGNLARLAENGGNSFRNWREPDSPDGLPLLDEAAKYGLTVAMCLPVGRERHGFDYDDEDAVARQLEFARSEVLRYKDHPALLLWIIGNEPDLGFENPKVFDAINDIAKMIHQVDGNHPATTALSYSYSPELAALVRDRMPDLDIISVQKYADIVNLPGYIESAQIDRPYLVTEYGPVGHWEVLKTEWGAPIEHNSSDKAAHYLDRYRDTISAHAGRILGSYAFLWSQKQERTPTWYGMFLQSGEATEAVDVMHLAWKGDWPDNRSPGIESMTLDSKTAGQSVILQAGVEYPARVRSVDPDGDPLSFHWEVMRESTATQVGGDRETVPEVLPGILKSSVDGTAIIRAPGEPGAYRLFVYVYDGQGHAGHANIPFKVN